MFVVKWYFIQYQSRSLLFYPPMWSYTSCFSVCLKVTKNGIAWMKPWDTQNYILFWRRKNKVSHSQNDCGENCFMAGGLYKVPINLQNVTWAQQPQLGNSIAMFKSVWGGGWWWYFGSNSSSCNSSICSAPFEAAPGVCLENKTPVADHVRTNHLIIIL